jgi:hypothetical protein
MGSSSGTARSTPIAGMPAPDAPEGARVRRDRFVSGPIYGPTTLYLRPTNGRADNRAPQSFRTHGFAPGLAVVPLVRNAVPVQAKIDLQPNVWTAIRIVRSDRAAPRPRPAAADAHRQRRQRRSATGSVALWIDRGSIPHFRSLVVTP